MSLESLPSLRDVKEVEKEELFVRKLKVCEVRFDFSNIRAHFAKKEAKRRHLVDIADYVSSKRGVFTEVTLKPFMDMVCANILRSLPLTSCSERPYDADDEDCSLEPSWPHLQIVYELLRKFIVSSDAESMQARAQITPRFVIGIIELFNSEDPREREYLKTILHRIYGKVMPLRAPIRQAIMNVFYRVVHEKQRHNGIGELLEILGAIINGFAIPLKSEHKNLLFKALLPLHSSDCMPLYHVQLSFCVTQFVEKEPEMAPDVVREIIRYWPSRHSRKELLIVNELEELLELAKPQEMADVIVTVFKKLSRSLQSAHYQLAERALSLWGNEYIVNLFMQYQDSLMPLVVGPLHENVNGHWYSGVREQSEKVQKLLCDLDFELYEASMNNYLRSAKKAKQEEMARQNRWRALLKLATERKKRRGATFTACSGESNGRTEAIANGYHRNAPVEPELNKRASADSEAEYEVSNSEYIRIENVETRQSRATRSFMGREDGDVSHRDKEQRAASTESGRTEPESSDEGIGNCAQCGPESGKCDVKIGNVDARRDVRREGRERISSTSIQRELVTDSLSTFVGERSSTDPIRADSTSKSALQLRSQG